MTKRANGEEGGSGKGNDKDARTTPPAPRPTRRGQPSEPNPTTTAPPNHRHEPLLMGWTGVLCEDGRARGTEGTSVPTTCTRHCEQLLAWGIAETV
jgi:hypothetical protein